MQQPFENTTSRRQFLQATTQAAAVGAALTATAPQLFAAENGKVKVALVGCGGRGTGAATNALSVSNGPTQLVAMADVFDHKMKNSFDNLSVQFPSADQMDVPTERKFIGFDAYKKAMDCLSPGDIVILTTPAAFRWVQFQYAIEKGLHVFMEKPVTVDGPTSARMLELNKKAIEKGIKVGVGLMCRHCLARKDLFDRIQGGEIGDTLMIRAYRMAGKTASEATGPRPASSKSELMYQIANFHSFLWLSGGAVSDFLIHNIDESCWMKNDWPVSVHALGGRHYKKYMATNDDAVDQNFDSYAMEYTFKDGTKMFVDGRTIPGHHNEFASYIHGSKGVGVISTAGHHPAKCRIYKGHNLDEANMTWAYPQPEKNPYQLEWDDFLDAIRNDKPYNEVERGVMASAVTSMGRMAAHTGQMWTLKDFLDPDVNDHEFAPNVADLTLDGESPLKADASGRYPIPLPGINKTREY
jgi:predicted dehydrogenase